MGRGQIERALRLRGGARRVAGGQPRLGQRRVEQRLPAHQRDGRRLRDGLLEQALALPHAAREDVHRPQRGRESREPEEDVVLAAQREPALEQRARVLEIALPEMHDTEPRAGHDQVERRLHRLGDRDGFAPAGDAVGKAAELRETPGERRALVDRRQLRQAEAVAPVVADEGDVAREQLRRTLVFAAVVERLAEVRGGGHAQARVVERFRQLQGAGARPPRSGRVAHAQAEMAGRVERALAEPAAVAAPLRETLGLAQVLGQARELAEGQQRRAQVEAQVDRLLGALLAFRQAAERRQRALQDVGGLAVGGAAQGLDTRLPEIDDGAVPQAADEGVMREPLDQLQLAVRIDLLHGLEDPLVQGAPLLGQEQVVRDLPHERVGERVLGLAAGGALVEEFRGLQPRQPPPDDVRRLVHQRGRQREGNVAADRRQREKQLALLQRQAIDARHQQLLDRRRHRHAGREATALAHRARELLEEERVALGAREHGVHQRVGDGRVAQDRAHEGEAVGGRQRRQRDLGRVRLVDPRRAIAGTVGRDE